MHTHPLDLRFVKWDPLIIFFYSSYQSILARTIDANALFPYSPTSTSGTSEIKPLSARPHVAPGKDTGPRGEPFPRGSQTVPQPMGTSPARPLTASGAPQGQQHPKDFDDWFYGLEHCTCWLSTPWHSSPTPLVSGECYFGD